MSEPITVTDWLEQEEIGDRRDSCGSMGGWVEGHSWAEYLEAMSPEQHPYLEALKAEILRLHLRAGGFWHQSAGTPLFSDGTVAEFSMRGWGDLMAAIWSEADGRPYSYCRFAWTDDAAEREAGDRLAPADA